MEEGTFIVKSKDVSELGRQRHGRVRVDMKGDKSEDSYICAA